MLTLEELRETAHMALEFLDGIKDGISLLVYIKYFWGLMKKL